MQEPPEQEIEAGAMPEAAQSKGEENIEKGTGQAFL